jgi:hypothetical protein
MKSPEAEAVCWLSCPTIPDCLRLLQYQRVTRKYLAASRPEASSVA